jgi:hypothetical protein
MRGDPTWLEVTVQVEGAFASPRNRLRWEVFGLAGAPSGVEVDGQDTDTWRWDTTAGVLTVDTGLCRRLAVQVTAR